MMFSRICLLKYKYVFFCENLQFSVGPYRVNISFQVILLSATMPTDVMEVTNHFMRNPIRILVKKEELTLEGIKQFYVQV